MGEYKYYKSSNLGEGTYAVIHLGYQIHITNNHQIEENTSKFISIKPVKDYKIVAIKRIKKSEQSSGHEVSSFREVKSLKMIKSPYVVELLDVFIYKKSLHLILEYIDYDLEKVLRNRDIIIMPADTKSWMFMLLTGLKACHDNFFVHRDLKPNNILISADGSLKLADFGISRLISDRMTPSAIARWYRPPELLIGQSHYSFKADMWSVGAIFAELFLRVPLFSADTDIKQLEQIFKILGTPKDPKYVEVTGNGFDLRNHSPVNLKTIFTAITDEELSLLKGLLEYDPNKRLSVEEALNHKYFRTKPYATKIGNFSFIKHMPFPKNKS